MRATSNICGTKPSSMAVITAVRFPGSIKLYHYWTNGAWHLQPGDEIIVSAPVYQVRGRYEHKVVTVVATNVNGAGEYKAAVRVHSRAKDAAMENKVEQYIFKPGDVGVTREGTPYFVKCLPSNYGSNLVWVRIGQEIDVAYFNNGKTNRQPNLGNDLMPPKATGWTLEEYLEAQKAKNTYAAYEATMQSLLPSTQISAALAASVMSSINYKPNVIKETTMDKITITHQTLVNGANIEHLSQEQLTDVIVAAENKIAKLEAIKTKTKATKAQIAELQNGIAEVLALADSKFDSTNPTVSSEP